MSWLKNVLQGTQCPAKFSSRNPTYKGCECYRALGHTGDHKSRLIEWEKSNRPGSSPKGTWHIIDNSVACPRCKKKFPNDKELWNHMKREIK